MPGFQKADLETEYTRNTSVLTCSASSGIQQFDKLFNLAPCSLTCLFEDPYSFIHNTFLQIIYSSFVDQQKSVYMCSTEEKHKVRYSRHVRQSEAARSDPILIAWRYKNTNEQPETQQWDLMNKQEIDSKTAIQGLNELLTHMEENKNCFYTIFSLFSPLYGKYTEQEMSEILFKIKRATRTNKHTVVLSFPAFLYKQSFCVFFDCVLQIVNNLTLPHETPLYCGYVQVQKVSVLGKLQVNSLESFKYGIVLKTKSIAIEQIDVPPEDVGTAESCAIKF